MPAVLSAHAPQVLTDYYRVLEGGAAAYGDGATLLTFQDGRIATLRLHYDGREYAEKGGR